MNRKDFLKLLGITAVAPVVKAVPISLTPTAANPLVQITEGINYQDLIVAIRSNEGVLSAYRTHGQLIKPLNVSIDDLKTYRSRFGDCVFWIAFAAAAGSKTTRAVQNGGWLFRLEFARFAESVYQLYHSKHPAPVD